jgi:hypothetical protein
MNLEWKHFPLVMLGGTIGAGLGWLVSFLFRPGVLPDFEPALDSHGTGAVIGGIAGLGFAVVAIVVKAGRDPNIGPASYFVQFKGMGSTLIGHSDAREDGSYVATEWFTILWIPLFPICQYRVTPHEEASTPFSTPYTIHEKLPVRFRDAARVYGITVLILCGIALVLLALIGFAHLLSG